MKILLTLMMLTVSTAFAEGENSESPAGYTQVDKAIVDETFKWSADDGEKTFKWSADDGETTIQWVGGEVIQWSPKVGNVKWIWSTPKGNMQAVEKQISFLEAADYKKQMATELKKLKLKHEAEIERTKANFLKFEKQRNQKLQLLKDKLVILRKQEEQEKQEKAAREKRLSELKRLAVAISQPETAVKKDEPSLRSELEELKKSNMELKQMILELKESLKDRK